MDVIAYPDDIFPVYNENGKVRFWTTMSAYIELIETTKKIQEEIFIEVFWKRINRPNATDNSRTV